MDFSALRREYTRMSLSVSDLDPDPMKQFVNWISEAQQAGVEEINAMALSTTDAGGNPSCRMVLLKELDNKGFLFFTHYNSRKGADLAVNPGVAVLFYWKELERQVRIEGMVERITREESLTYFLSRPRGSRISAFVSPQSRVIESRAFLEQQWDEVAGIAEGDDIPFPSDWGGYRILPHTMEFFQGREYRLHDRIRYRVSNGEWIRERLAP